MAHRTLTTLMTMAHRTLTTLMTMAHRTLTTLMTMAHRTLTTLMTMAHMTRCLITLATLLEMMEALQIWRNRLKTKEVTGTRLR